MPEIRPRKAPKQARSKVTVDAIVEACARLLRERADDGGPEAVTTNHVAERAGVSIGTLYEFFPSKEAILAALAQRQLAALREAVVAGLEATRGLAPREALEKLIARLVELVAADRALFRFVHREAPFLLRLPETQETRGAILALAHARAESLRDAIDLPEPAADGWLVLRMVSSAVVEIAIADAAPAPRDVLVRELARLVHRMLGTREAGRNATSRGS